MFAEDYKKELLLQYIDNINTYYVALTRAIKGMTIISDINASPEKNFAGILMCFLENDGPAKGFSSESFDDGQVKVFRIGDLYNFSKLERKDGEISKIEIGYPSFPLNPETAEDGKERSRLKIPTDSSDFFTEEGRARNEARENGTILHDILSRVKVPSDLERSVLQAVRLGDLDEGKAGKVQELLSERIASHPEWFPEDGTEILNETALFDADGMEWRPDRVLLSKDGKVTVIDYKFGEPDPRYRTQVAKYAAIYRRLGYTDVSTFIWYVPANMVD